MHAAAISFRARLAWIALLAIGCHGLALAGEDYLQNCPLKKGDTLASVKQFYHISVDPTAVEQPAKGAANFLYRIRDIGVTIFFDEDKLVQDIRFERPFAGKVGGFAIGDAKAKLVGANGEPLRKFQGLPDAEFLDARARRKRDIIESLPDPAPKDAVRKAFAAVEEANALPATYNTAWIYKNKDGSMSRYDLSSVSILIQAIQSEKGTAPVRPPAEALQAMTEQSLRAFFQQADQSYTNGQPADFIDQYAENCVISVNGKVLSGGRNARKAEVFGILVGQDLRLSETLIHKLFIAADGQSATANLTTTERYRKQVGDIRNVSSVLRPVFHNFAIIDERTVALALVDGAIKITRDDVLKREISENAGK